MKISSKGRYAVRIMAELAKSGNALVSVAELSERQGITVKYTEKIISMLLKANLIESVRGAQGGYRLLKAPEEYSVYEVLGATGDLPEIAPCLKRGTSCVRAVGCDSIGCWEKLDGMITNYLREVKISDLVKR